jgi:predicted nucleic acid-binding protein
MIVVNDANILIDLLKIDLLDGFFRLGFDFQVTDLVFAEIQEENAAELFRYMESDLLTRHGFSFNELGEIQKLRNEHSTLSIADCSCLYLSQRLSAVLLTGDGALRRIAEQHDITVHGILWVFDEMIHEGMLSANEARRRLAELMERNPRLPANECKKRIRAWKDMP